MHPRARISAGARAIGAPGACRLAAFGLAFSLLCTLSPAAQMAKVYIGGGDEHLGAFDGYINDPNGWTWVRQNADGYYINTFPLSDDPNNATINGELSTMSSLFTNKNVMYETEAESYANRIFDADDKARIPILQQNGFNVTYTTCNGNFTDARATILKTYSGTRPLLALQGPWAIGGDINSTNSLAVQWRTLITKNNGSSTDSPLAIWASNQNNCRNGSYSGVKYSHAQGKIAEVMLCPHGLGTDANWLSMSKQYVRDHEDNDALPDIWAVSYYAAYLEAHAVTPEQVNGAPAASVTGVGYYIIHHLKDPDGVATLSAPAQNNLTNTSYGADIGISAASQTFTVNLANSSSWLDLAAVVRARVEDANSAWNITLTYGGQDVTSAMKSSSGYCFYKTNRLNPNSTKTITVTVAAKSGKTSSAPLAIYFDLLPHPTVPLVHQTFLLKKTGTFYEAENATLSGALVGSNWAGYSGTGFADYQNASNDYVDWTVTTAAAGTYQLQFRYANGGATDRPLQMQVNGTVVNSSLSFPVTGSYTNWGVTTANVTLNSGDNHVRLKATGSSGSNIDYLGVVTTTAPLPSPWQALDIGSVGFPGTSTYSYDSSATYTITASGADIYGTSDQFRFVEQSGGSTCSVTARVLSINDTDISAKSGVMIRETTANNSAFAAVLATAANGIKFETRTSTSASTSRMDAQGILPPYWVRITRSGSTFTGSISADGSTWTTLGTSTITMASSVKVGLALTSHNNAELCTSAMSNVSAP